MEQSGHALERSSTLATNASTDLELATGVPDRTLSFHHIARRRLRTSIEMGSGPQRLVSLLVHFVTNFAAFSSDGWLMITIGKFEYKRYG